MTEQEWMRCSDPLAMLDALAGDEHSPSDRKLRLWVAQCALLAGVGQRGEVQWWLKPWSEGLPAKDEQRFDAEQIAPLIRTWPNNEPIFDGAGAALLRDIIGNPFAPHPSRFDVGYQSSVRGLTRTIVVTAEHIYTTQDFTNLPVLADMLEECGEASEVLGHLRSPGPHVRDCWALDLVLGKS